MDGVSGNDDIDDGDSDGIVDDCCSTSPIVPLCIIVIIILPLPVVVVVVVVES